MNVAEDIPVSESPPNEGLLQRISSANLSGLMALWAARQAEHWFTSPELYQQLTKTLLGHGEPLLAYDVVREALTLWPSDIRLRQLQGLALARSGATERANAILQELRREGATDEETLGMLGRTYKDLAARAKSSDRKNLLKQAAEIYGEAYQTSGGYWSGINAATMNLLIGDQSRACEIAQQVRDQCTAELVRPSGDHYWTYAALGEAALICRDWDEAKKRYAEAATHAHKRYGDLESSRRNARLILEHWGQNLPEVEQSLHVPPVMVFAGHMIDRPGRLDRRFPPEEEGNVAARIKGRIAEVKPAYGFSSAAGGSDILFLEAMLDYGAEISVVLPYNVEQFIADSVDIIPGSNWAERFRDVLGRAAQVVISSPQRLEIGGVSYEFCNRLLLGLACIRARQLQTNLVPLAVWNGQTGDGPGGSASVVQEWRSLGLQPTVLDLPAVAAVYDRRNVEAAAAKAGVSAPGYRFPKTTKAAGDRPPLQGFTSRVVSILFADAVGFSKLSEAEVPCFVEHFLGAIAAVGKRYEGSILARNTWGDGLYFIFSDSTAAGEFGLELAGLVAGTDWRAKGLRTSLSLRIGLHAGPVYEFDEPVTGQRTYSGTHVSRAARIEPITPPGLVYASESFAALSAADGAKGFVCDYVGQIPLAKDYGTLPAYHVRRRSAS